MPKGVTSLPTQVKILANGIASAPASFSYIPKKLSQVLTATLPAAKTIINLGSTFTSTSSVTSSNPSNPPLVTATPSSVCSSRINILGKLEVTTISIGVCSISVIVPGTPAFTATAAKATTFLIKANRTVGLTATVRDVLGGANDPEHVLTMANTSIGLTAANVAIYLGDNPVDVPIRFNKAEGTIALTVDKADAARCSAEAPGDDRTLAFITVNNLGSCKVTITLPGDDGWHPGTEKIVVWINATLPPSGVNPTPTGTGDGVLADPIFNDTNPLDPDSDPAVMLVQTGASVTASLGGDLSMTYDAVTGKYSFRSKTLLVGNYKATMTGPAGTNWFAQASTTTQCTKFSKGKCVKSIKVPVTLAVNKCINTLTVKKDPKLKKRVLRIVGPGCQLNEAGKAAFNQVGVQNIVMNYLWNRQYPSTGLSYVKKGKIKERFLKKVKRNIVLSVGRPSN